MTTVYDNYQRERIGWFFGLGWGKFTGLMLGTLPTLFALSRLAWASMLIFASLWVVALLLLTVPVRGRSATRWARDATRTALGGMLGWTTFRSKASQGQVEDLATPDLPGVLAGIEIHDGPPHGTDQRRIAVIQNHAANTWAITAQTVHPGIGMSDSTQRRHYGEGLTALLDQVEGGETVAEVIQIVRTVPDDGAEREQWVKKHQRVDAPPLAVKINADLHAHTTQAGVHTESFFTFVVPKDRIAKAAKDSGGGLEGTCRALYLTMEEIGALLTERLGMTSVRWLTSPELAVACRTGFAPGDRAGIIEALAARETDPDVNADIPLALAGPGQADNAMRHYSHDVWDSTSITIKLPTKGAVMGAVDPILTPSHPGERRCFTVVYPIVKMAKAERESDRREFTADLADEVNRHFGRKTKPKQDQEADKARGMGGKLAKGNSMTTPYAIATVTVPKTEQINQFGRQLTASARRAGFPPVPLDLAHDTAFAASVIPFGTSLTPRNA